MQETASIYVHIPFCRSKCIYCDFASLANMDHLMEPYIAALLAEIQHAHPVRVKSVYFGGGTPSHLPMEMIEKIIAALRKKFDFSGDSEQTIEVNPRSATLETLQRYRKIGFNRLSVGVQSFNDKMLKTLGRAHGASEAVETVKLGRSAGFTNLSIDLIFGIPGQTTADLNSDIQEALALNPDHISAYQLTVEEDTPLWELVEEGRAAMPDDDLLLTMYETVITRLENSGYRHYEVSNFSRPGRECEHNLAYWMGEPFLGLGSGAHSFMDGIRYANPDDPETYVYEMDTAGKTGVEIHSDETEKIMDFLLMRLRLVEKELTFDEFNKKFKKDFGLIYSEQLKFIEKQGLANVTASYFKLTKKGLFLLDDLLLILE